MPPPPQGVGSLGTLKNAQIVLSDEEDTNNSVHHQDASSHMDYDRDTDTTHRTNGRQNSSSLEMVVSDTTSTKTKTVKLFNLESDKYNSNLIYVFIEKTNEENIGRLHPLVVGHILHKKLSIKNIISIKSAGKNRVKIQLRSTKDANLLVNNKLLETENLRAFIPNHLLEKKGLIRGVDTFFDNDYLQENIISPAKVINIQRMHRKIVKDNKSVLVPKQSMIITFEGNVLPNEIIINSVVFPVEFFFGRVTQCYHCLKYGHISKQCRSSNSPLCINCGQSKIENHECFERDTYCIHCKTKDHRSNSKNCPVFEKQKKIKKIMVEHNSTFNEAKEYCENSFANLISLNKFSILSDANSYDENFPALSTQKPTSSNQTNFKTQRKPNNRTNLSLSQPSTSNVHNSNPNKKRKFSPSSPPTPMFPFKFSGPSPIPPNNNTPSYHLEKNKICESLSQFVIDFLNKIKSLDDIKKINLDDFRRNMDTLLEDNFISK